jgi:antitoxin component of RelBE/YafQ-DinJ toxin-antitoxin module
MAKTIVITLRIEEDTYNTCKAIAEKEEIPASYVIRRALKRGLNTESKHHIKNTAPTIPEWE